MRQRNPQRLLAYALIIVGMIMLLSRIGGADWLWLALISALFLSGYVSRKNYNFLVACGVLMGIAVGTLIGTDSGMLLSLAAGFLAIDRIEPKPNRWALISAGIFAGLGALVALGSFGLLSSAAFALVLVAAGAYLLYREGDKPNAFSTSTPTSVSTPGQTSQTPPAPASEAAGEPYSSVQGSVKSGADAQRDAAETPEPSGTFLEDAPSENVTQAEAVETEAARPAPPAPAVLSGEAAARLRKLEAWRRETAAADGVPPYIVFSNDTLAKIAAANPQTLGELATVKGVGPVKLSRYGETVLGVVYAVPESLAS